MPAIMEAAVHTCSGSGQDISRTSSRMPCTFIGCSLSITEQLACSHAAYDRQGRKLTPMSPGSWTAARGLFCIAALRLFRSSSEIDSCTSSTTCKSHACAQKHRQAILTCGRSGPRQRTGCGCKSSCSGDGGGVLGSAVSDALEACATSSCCCCCSSTAGFFSASVFAALGACRCCFFLAHTHNL